MKKYDYILIDTMMICYRSWFSLSTLNIKMDGETHGVAIPVGLVKTIMHLAEMFAHEETKIVMCLDSKTKDLHRKRIFPAYKEKRKDQYTKEQMEDLFSQVKMAMKIVSILPVHQCGRFGYESDDVMFTLAKRYGENGKVLIVSSDKDMYQCLNRNVRMLVNRETTVMTRKRLQEEKGFTPKQFLAMQCLMGDPADCIPGIKGIGLAKALDTVKAYPDIVKDVKLNRVIMEKVPTSARNKFRKDHSKTVQLTEKLVKLCFIPGLGLKKGSGDKEGVMELLTQISAHTLSMEVEKSKWLQAKWTS